jgi:hypothetical protein
MSTNTQTTSFLSDLAPLLSIGETASLLHLSRRRVSDLLSEGRLRGPKITRSRGPAGRRLILRESLEQLIADGMDAPGEAAR